MEMIKIVVVEAEVVLVVVEVNGIVWWKGYWKWW